MDVAGVPHIYPVFDAERGFDLNGDGKYVFPDEVPTDPNVPGLRGAREHQPVAQVDRAARAARRSSSAPATCTRAARASTSRSPATVPTPATSTATTRPRSDRCSGPNAHYYEPAGAVSWDVSMEATRPDWRISLKEGDMLSINVTYDVRKASWYESMGILPLSVTTYDDPAAKDPFDDDAAVKAMYDEGGILTHGRLPENIDKKARKDLKIPDPRKLKQQGHAGARRRDRDQRLRLLARRLLGLPRLPDRARCARRWSSRVRASPSPTSTRCPR